MIDRLSYPDVHEVASILVQAGVTSEELLSVTRPEHMVRYTERLVSELVARHQCAELRTKNTEGWARSPARGHAWVLLVTRDFQVRTEQRRPEGLRDRLRLPVSRDPTRSVFLPPSSVVYPEEPYEREVTFEQRGRWTYEGRTFLLRYVEVDRR